MRRMDPLPPEVLLADYPGPMGDIADWLRGVVRRAVPQAVERVRTGWRIIGYDVPLGPRRSAYFAWIMIESVHVHLGFVHGVLVDDPRGLMDGAGITRRARWTTLTPDALLDEADLAALVRDAARVAGLSRGERFALSMSRTEIG